MTLKLRKAERLQRFRLMQQIKKIGGMGSIFPCFRRQYQLGVDKADEGEKSMKRWNPSSS